MTSRSDESADAAEELKESTYKSYRSRWLMLSIFCWLNLCNAVLFVTFAPISDKAEHYFGGKLAGPTYVNLLATIFLILYPFGTLIGVGLSQTYKLKTTLVFAGSLNMTGSLIRLFSVIYRERLGGSYCYALMFFGQSLAAITYPIYVNLPAAIAAIWFPVNERDMTTTIGAMFNPIGNAIGQIIPVLTITQTTDEFGAYEVHGMEKLMLIEFIMCIAPLVLAVIMFKDQPLTPPSHSQALKLHQSEKTLSDNGGKIEWRSIFRSAKVLFKDRNFFILFVSFSLSVGMLNGLMTLFNQLLSPHGYSNANAGTLAAVCIFSGLMGAAFGGYLMEKTQAYRVILKTEIVLIFVFVTIFLSMLYSNNLIALLITVALVGFVSLPGIPIMMECCVECTYPISEELSTGILHNGANILAVGIVFIAQYLLSLPPLSAPAPFQPTSIFIISILAITLVILMQFTGAYKRLAQDTLMNVSESLSEQQIEGLLAYSHLIHPPAPVQQKV